MLQQAVGRTITTYIVGGYEISAATIKLVGWVIFGRMNAAGCLVGPDGRPFSRTVIAADASIGERACRAAITFLKQGGLVSADPARGRRREMLWVNPWGLTWNAVKRRVKIEIHRNRGDAASPQEQPSQEQLSLSRRVVGATAQDRRVVAPTTLRSRRVVGATALQGYVSEGYVQERPGPQAGGAAVPSTTRAEAAAQGRPAALDLDALIERDQQRPRPPTAPRSTARSRARPSRQPTDEPRTTAERSRARRSRACWLMSGLRGRSRLDPPPHLGRPPSRRARTITPTATPPRRKPETRSCASSGWPPRARERAARSGAPSAASPGRAPSALGAAPGTLPVAPRPTRPPAATPDRRGARPADEAPLHAV